MHAILALSIFLQIGQVKCFYQGEILWEDTEGRLRKNGKEQMTHPKRWIRSLYNWIHSPLMNSLGPEEIFDKFSEIAGDASNPPTPKSVPHFEKQCTERFEEEFFLWQDGEGNPLKFGLNQIEDAGNRGFYKNKINDKSGKREISKSSSNWQDPLFYEDNSDVESLYHDPQLQSFHEEVKLKDLVKNKFNTFANIFHSKKKALKPDKIKKNKSSNRVMEGNLTMFENKISGNARENSSNNINITDPSKNETFCIDEVNFTHPASNINPDQKNNN